MPGADAGPGVACLPPEGEYAGSCGGPVWARDVATGGCCEYPTVCVVPQVMPRFLTLEQCQTDCRCGRVDQVNDSFAGSYSNAEHTTLECYCQSGNCPADLLTRARRDWCGTAISPYVTRLEGCGRVVLKTEGGYTGSEYVFDAASGALIGLSTSSDIRSEPCWAFHVVAGREFDCNDFTECRLCPQSTGSNSALPECE